MSNEPIVIRERRKVVSDSGELDFDTPRQSNARIPIFCELCRKQGKITYRQNDDPRYGGGHYSGPTMKLTAYLAGSPKVCTTCDKRMLATMEVFDE